MNSNDKLFTVPCFISANLKDLPITVHEASPKYPFDLAGKEYVSGLWRDHCKERLIPLFAPQNEQGDISIQGKFCLLWYPEIPVSSDYHKAYMEKIQPATICKDITGFYLGGLQDPNVCMFEKTKDPQEYCLVKVEEGSYLNKPVARKSPVYLKI